MLEFLKYELINNTVLQDRDKSYISMISFEELKDMYGVLHLDKDHICHLMNEDGCRFESHEGFDLISIDVLDAKQPQKDKPHIFIYLRNNILVFIGSCGEHLSSAVEQLKESKMDGMGVDDVLYHILDIIIADDFDALEDMEDRISFLEEEVVTNKRKNCIRQVMGFRRDLREMKKFYQQMYMVCEQIVENDNGIISTETIKYFKTLRSKMDRLLNMVLSLRDYVTQVRDAYQAQVDISQNNIMKFFTVVTSIFLPLTLIVGWYGMNLQMPEFEWEYGYLYVICLSIFIIVALIINFKKKKWF